MAKKLVLASEEVADSCSFDADEMPDGRVGTQHRYYTYGDDHLIVVCELNTPNVWDDPEFQAVCEDIEARLNA